MGLSWRKFPAGLAAAGALGVLVPPETALARRRETITLTAVATRTGEYLYLPFEVPRQANRLDVKLTIYLSATLGGQSPIIGGTVYGAASDVAEVSARPQGREDATVPLARREPGADDAYHHRPPNRDPSAADRAGGYVRAELRGEPYVDPNPRASRQDMEALINPTFLVVGSRLAMFPDEAGPTLAWRL